MVRAVVISSCLALMLAVGTAFSRTIDFSGYQWDVRPSEVGGPGPNHWDEDNAFVDRRGFLHLKLTERNGEWYCAEVSTTQALGFGLYQFSLVGRVDLFDPNVVLGLFNYPEPNVGEDGTNEIDIEFARWGTAANPIDNFTVYPAVSGVGPTSVSYPLTLRGAGPSSHTFNWTASSILFQSFDRANPSGTPRVSYLFAPRNAKRLIPQSPLPVHMNLWLFQGRPPTDGEEVEVVIRSFSFNPL